MTDRTGGTAAPPPPVRLCAGTCGHGVFDVEVWQTGPMQPGPSASAVGSPRPAPMLARQRQEHILERVAATGGVRVADVVEELDLDNVTIRRARAEEVKDRYDVVTARAVANLSKLVRLTAPLLRPGGALLALKGMRAQDEVDDAKYVIKKAKLSVAVIHEVVTAGDETTAVVEIRRTKNR